MIEVGQLFLLLWMDDFSLNSIPFNSSKSYVEFITSILLYWLLVWLCFLTNFDLLREKENVKRKRFMCDIWVYDQSDNWLMYWSEMFQESNPLESARHLSGCCSKEVEPFTKERRRFLPHIINAHARGIHSRTRSLVFKRFSCPPVSAEHSLGISVIAPRRAWKGILQISILLKYCSDLFELYGFGRSKLVVRRLDLFHFSH